MLMSELDDAKIQLEHFRLQSDHISSYHHQKMMNHGYKVLINHCPDLGLTPRKLTGIIQCQHCGNITADTQQPEKFQEGEAQPLQV